MITSHVEIGELSLTSYIGRLLSRDLQGDFLITVRVTSTIKMVLTDIPLLLLELGHVLDTKQ